MTGAVLGALRSLTGRPAGPPLAPTERAVPYRATRTRGIAPLADIYLPARPSGASVVLVHGGAFVIGSRRMKPMRFLAARFARAGIAACAIDYRLIFRGGRVDEAVADVVDAVAFWCGRAPRHGCATVSLVGLSAGASLALLAAARSPQLHRLACCFGLYETAHLSRPITSVLPRLMYRTADRVEWERRALRHAPQPAMPTLLLHGSADGLVPVVQAERLAAHRVALGLPTRLVVYPGAPHGFFNFASREAELGVRELVAHVSQRDVA